MTRELVLDTETTGLNHEIGHRLVEIGIIELDNHVPTGNYFHYYLNPERESDEAALRVHGLSKEFLSDKPKFVEIVEEFIEFISDSKIIIHNASFDVGFINAELKRCNISELNNDCIIDTLQMAKKKFLGQSVSLDSLCRKFNIDLSERNTHGALKDAKLGDTPETLENPERVGVMVGSAFGGMETFEKETLKLAKKPERPKVR